MRFVMLAEQQGRHLRLRRTHDLGDFSSQQILEKELLLEPQGH